MEIYTNNYSNDRYIGYRITNSDTRTDVFISRLHLNTKEFQHWHYNRCNKRKKFKR